MSVPFHLSISFSLSFPLASNPAWLEGRQRRAFLRFFFLSFLSGGGGSFFLLPDGKGGSQ